MLVTTAVSDVIPDLNLNTTMGHDFPIIIIFTFFIIAEVFALGVKMKEESDLTV